MKDPFTASETKKTRWETQNPVSLHIRFEALAALQPLRVYSFSEEMPLANLDRSFEDQHTSL